MESFNTGNQLEIEKEIMQLKEKILRTKNFSEATSCLSSIYNLNDLYKVVTGSQFLSFKKVEQLVPEKTVSSIKYQKQSENAFIDSFIENEDFISFVSGTAYDQIGECRETISAREYSPMEEIFSHSDAYTFVHDFLKEYHPNDLSVFEEMIKNKRIFHLSDMNFISERLRGQCYPVYQSLPFILSQCTYYTVETLSYFVHEFGHVCDFIDLENRFSNNQQNKYIRRTFNDEISSKLYEKQFLEFMIKQNIEPDVSAWLLFEYHRNTQENLLETFLFTQFPNFLLYDNNYYNATSEYLKEQLNNPDLESIVQRELEFDSLDLASAVHYATGGLVATVLQDHFNEDKKHGHKIYQHYMNERCRPFNPEFIHLLEYQEGDFAKILKKDFQKIENSRK